MISPEWDSQLKRELCIRCGKPTPYDIHTPISSRLYYIDGSGQLCEECWKRVYGEIKSNRQLITMSLT